MSGAASVRYEECREGIELDLNKGEPPISVLIVDDHCIVREGLVALLERSARLRVIGTAENGREAIEAALLLKPDIVVMDVVLPELSGFDATERIVRALPATRV